MIVRRSKTGRGFARKRTALLVGGLLAASAMAPHAAGAFTVDNRTVNSGNGGAPLAEDQSTNPSDPNAGFSVQQRQRWQTRESLPNAPEIGHPEGHHLFWENNSDWRRSTRSR